MPMLTVTDNPLVYGQIRAPVTKLENPKNPTTRKIIKILLLMSESLSAHDINTGISSQYESIVACYILHLYLFEPPIAFWAIVVDKGC